MPIPSHKAVARTKAVAFNYNKLQAVACMGASALVSITLIVWAIKSFF